MASAHEAASSSDDEDDDDADCAGPSSCGRVRREIVSCEGPQTTYAAKRPPITWPPPRTSAAAGTWRNLRPAPRMRQGNPVLGNRMQLFSRTNHFLAVYPDGTVKGTGDPDDLHTHLEVQSTKEPGQVRIRGMLTGMYVAMDGEGRLYAEVREELPDSTAEETIFIETFQGSYNTYLSMKNAHRGWYIGIKKSGRFKKGPKTKYGQKAIQFLPRRTKFE